MSTIVGEKSGIVDFKWKVKRRVDENGIIVYESFTYDGLDYFLYDCVYLYKKEEPEPSIGKIIRIWETPDKGKRVKILWFFRPSEISNWLEDKDTLKNELFLASGEGVGPGERAGLTNINPLESIAGKCNIVCTSKDKRNLQPSQKELQEADYIFYRTFDVKKCKVVNKISETIAGINVKCIFNRKPFLKPREPDLERIEGVPCELISRTAETVATVKEGHVADHKTRKVNSSLIKQEYDEEKVKSIENGVRKDIALGENSSLKSNVDPFMLEEKINKNHVHQTLVDEKMKFSKDCSLDDRLLEKVNLNSYFQSSQSMESNDLNEYGIDRDNSKALLLDTSIGGNMKFKRTRDSPRHESLPSKRLKPDGDMLELDNKRLLKNSPRDLLDDNIRNGGQLMEVIHRQNFDTSKWFKGPPWEDRMRAADRQGSLVLFLNLHPAYTSSQVEDIVLHGFHESCTAKIIQGTAISSPHFGQAYVAFKTREAAEKVIRKSNLESLMLSNGRPLVAMVSSPAKQETKTSFFGHCFIDKTKFLRHRDWKQGVSTSHCSQPNTIQYEMALEWSLLHERCAEAFMKLYKAHAEQLMRFKASLKSK